MILIIIMLIIMHLDDGDCHHDDGDCQHDNDGYHHHDHRDIGVDLVTVNIMIIIMPAVKERGA